MNQKLKEELNELVRQATLSHHCIHDRVPQIGAYHASEVALTELTDAEITLGIHQCRSVGHIFMLTESIKAIKEDCAGKKKILPRIIFTFNHEKEKVKIEPGRLNQIEFGDMSKDFFDMFLKFQRLLHQKVH